MNKKEQQDMSTFIESFRSEFYRRYKVIPNVHFNLEQAKKVKRIGLDEILIVANTLFKQEIQVNQKLKEKFNNKGIFDKRRDRPKTLYKHVCFLMARELKYSHQVIADKFDMKVHSSVVTSVKMATQLLNQGDYKMIRTYLHVAHAIKKEFGDDGSFQLDLPEGIKSKPIISALLNADWDSNIPHQHPPRVKSPRIRRVDKKPRVLEGTNLITGSSGAR
jgi:hypothetical protein